MYRYFLASFLISISAIFVTAQSLPLASWQLEEYNFAGTVEHALPGSSSTLVVKTDGKLGGSSGCNSYGGSYATEKGKLKISDIIHTMMACEEPTPQFESSFFSVMTSATSAKVKANTLTLTDKDRHYLKFVRRDR